MSLIPTAVLREELARRRGIAIQEIAQRLQRDKEVPLLNRQDSDLEPEGIAKKLMIADAVNILETRDSGPFSDDALEADPRLETFVNVSLIAWKLATNSETSKKLNEHAFAEVAYNPRTKSIGAAYYFHDFALIVPDKHANYYLHYRDFLLQEKRVWGFEAEARSPRGHYYDFRLEPEAAFECLAKFMHNTLKAEFSPVKAIV